MRRDFLKISAINGLRGLAIIGVLYHHLFYKFTSHGWHSFEFQSILITPYTYLANGWMGVNLFFILSGFVLFLPYVSNKRRFDSTSDILKFYRHRASRLLPLYYFSLIVCVILIGNVVGDNQLPKHLLKTLTFTFTFTKDTFFPVYNNVLWSLAIELMFSLVFPFLVVIYYHAGMIRLFICTAIFSLSYRYIGLHDSSLEINRVLNLVRDNLPGRLDDFVAGMFICYLYVNIKNKILSRPYLLLFIGGLLFSSTCYLWELKVAGRLNIYLIPWLYTCIWASFSFIILGALNLKGVMAKIFTSKPLQFIGLMCYSIYIWHSVAISGIVGDKYDIVHIGLYLALVFFLSFISYRYIEFGKERDLTKLLP